MKKVHDLVNVGYKVENNTSQACHVLQHVITKLLPPVGFFFLETENLYRPTIPTAPQPSVSNTQLKLD